MASPVEMFGGGGTTAEKNNSFCNHCNTFFTVPRHKYDTLDAATCSYCYTQIPMKEAVVSLWSDLKNGVKK